jgi:DNA repair exonuclease SbcCD ATPase subunit
LSIVKAIAVFIITALIVFAVSKFIPEYHEVNKDQLQALLGQIKYTENQENTADIDNVMDIIPVKAAILYKGDVISSNLSKTDRAGSGQNNLQSLTKNVQAGDLALNYKEDDPNNKNLLLLIPLFTGLVCSIIFLLMNRVVETNIGSSQTMREEIERLQTINEMYQQKEDEFSRKIDKQIPETLEECQKLLKSMIKEKEVIITEMEGFNEKEEELRKDIGNGKMQLNKQKEVNNGLENKIRELQGQLSAAARQEKQIEELNGKIEKHAVEVKEYKAKLKAYEKTDIDKINNENANLKIKVSEIDAQFKTAKDEIKELKKLDAEKLQTELATERQEKEDLKKEIKETKQQLKDAVAGLEGTDVGQIKLESLEYQKVISSLQKELKAAQENSQGGVPGDDPVKVDNLRIQLKEKDVEMDNLRFELKRVREMSDELKNGVSPDVLAAMEDKQMLSALQDRVIQLQEELNNRGSGGGSSEEVEELLREKDEQISIMRKQIINRELEVKRLKSEGGGSSISDFDLDAFEADLQKSKNLALKYKKERDDKIKNINSLNAAFESTNEALKRKEEELDLVDEKYKIKINEIRAQMETQTNELTSLNNKYRTKIDELKELVDKQTEELSALKGTSQMPG